MLLKRIALVIIAILGGLLIILVWNPTKPQTGSMLKAWADSVQNLGVRAIYPLQESLFPGQMLLVPTYPGKTKWYEEKPAEYYTHPPIRIGSLDLCLLYLSIKNSPDMPLITSYTSNGGVSGVGTPFTPWQPTDIKYSNFKCSEYKDADFRVNRTMAFPAFQFGSLAESGISGSVQSALAGFLGGFAGNNEYRLTVSIPSATVIRMEFQDLLSGINNSAYSTAGGIKSLQELIRKVMEVVKVKDKSGKSSDPELLLVQEVYYANAIDVSVSNSAAKASELSVNAQALAEQFDQLKAMRERFKALKVAGPTPDGSEKTPSSGGSQQDAMKVLEQQIAEKETQVDSLSKTILPGAPGVTGAVKSISSSGVTLTQVFPRPMAFGYRAIAFRPEQFLQVSTPVDAFEIYPFEAMKPQSPGAIKIQAPIPLLVR